MNDGESLQTQVENLRAKMQRLRADLAAYGVFSDALIIAMSPNARSALEANLEILGEAAVASTLAHSQSADDSSVHDLQAALDRLKAQLARLPRG